MLMCWCIGHAANPIAEFYTLPAGGRLWQYDCLAVNTVVMTSKGETHLCDIPFSEDLHQFNDDYLRLTRQVRDTVLVGCCRHKCMNDEIKTDYKS